MAVDQRGMIIGRTSAVDLTGSQYCGVVFGASGVALPGAAGAKIDGILQNAPDVGETADVMVLGAGGSSRVLLGATVTIGAEASAFGTAGTARVAATGHRVMGTFLGAGVAGEIVELLLGSSAVAP